MQENCNKTIKEGMKLTMSEKKKYGPTNDIVFKMLFGNQKNEKTTKKLIEDILKEKVEQIDLTKTPFLYGKTVDDKIGIVDIKAVINADTPIDIETC